MSQTGQALSLFASMSDGHLGSLFPSLPHLRHPIFFFLMFVFLSFVVALKKVLWHLVPHHLVPQCRARSETGEVADMLVTIGGFLMVLHPVLDEYVRP